MLNNLLKHNMWKDNNHFFLTNLKPSLNRNINSEPLHQFDKVS